MDWQARFGQALGLKVLQLTGDDDSLILDDLESADVICSTPEKFGELVSSASHSQAACQQSCQQGPMRRCWLRSLHVC